MAESPSQEPSADRLYFSVHAQICMPPKIIRPAHSLSFSFSLAVNSLTIILDSHTARTNHELPKTSAVFILRESLMWVISMFTHSQEPLRVRVKFPHNEGNFRMRLSGQLSRWKCIAIYQLKNYYINILIKYRDIIVVSNSNYAL